MNHKQGQQFVRLFVCLSAVLFRCCSFGWSENCVPQCAVRHTPALPFPVTCSFSRTDSLGSEKESTKNPQNDRERTQACQRTFIACLLACLRACLRTPSRHTQRMGSFSRPRPFSRVRFFPRDKNRDRYVAVSILPGLERESENRRCLGSYYRQRMNHCKTNHKNDPPRTRDQTRLSTLCVCACVDACLPVCI